MVEKNKKEIVLYGFVISSIRKYSLSSTNSMRSKVQQCLPKSIFNFTVKYLNNTLATMKNLHRWSISESPSCSFWHVVSGCKQYLDHGRYNWRHNWVLFCLSKSLSHLTDLSHYADLPSFPSSSLISGDTFRPDLIVYYRHSKKVHILELTVGFETNLRNNSDRKLNKYKPLIT